MAATVSIVTPSFNQARYLDETIESVVSQEGDFLIDYLVMDGGSTDGSVDVLRRWSDRLAGGEWTPRCRGARLRWVSEKDDGQTHAINKGIAQASGDVVAYINSDDAYLPGAFARVLDELARHPEADFVYGDGDVVNERSEVAWEWLSRPYDYAVLRSYHPLWNDFTNYIMQQATFWRRAVHDRIGTFDASLHFSMDLEFWLRAGAQGLTLRHLPVKLAKFRMIEGTKSLSTPTVFWLENMEIFRRHHSPRRMAGFFAYFHFNHALASDLRFEAAREAEETLFSRWAGLPASEVAALRRAAARGAVRAHLLLAMTALDRGLEDRARALFEQAVARRPHVRLHPLALVLSLRRSLGPARSDRLREWWRGGVRLYRKKRYLYRYN